MQNNTPRMDPAWTQFWQNYSNQIPTENPPSVKHSSWLFESAPPRLVPRHSSVDVASTTHTVVASQRSVQKEPFKDNDCGVGVETPLTPISLPPRQHNDTAAINIDFATSGIRDEPMMTESRPSHSQQPHSQQQHSQNSATRDSLSGDRFDSSDEVWSPEEPRDHEMNLTSHASTLGHAPDSHCSGDVKNDDDCRHNLMPLTHRDVDYGKLRPDPMGFGSYNFDYTPLDGFPEDEDDVLRIDGLHDYVENWRSRIPDSVHEPTAQANFWKPLNWMHDIDPVTRELVDRIDFPETYMNAADEDDGNTNMKRQWRRFNATSELVFREQMMQGAKLVEEQNRRNKVVVYGKPRKSPYEQINTDRPLNIDMACLLRPVVEDDLEDILDMYNYEIRYGRQVNDVLPLQLADIKRLYDSSLKEKLPFFACVQDESEIPMAKRSRIYPLPRRPQVKPGLLGFALISELEGGLCGIIPNDDNPQKDRRGRDLPSNRLASRFSCRLYIHVHHEFRGKNLSQAMLDQALAITSARYIWRGGYATDFPHDSLVYNSDGRLPNTRKFANIFIEGYHLRLGEDDPEYYRQYRMLEKFGFDEVARLPASHRTLGKKEDEWLDKVIFHHDGTGKHCA